MVFNGWLSLSKLIIGLLPLRLCEWICLETPSYSGVGILKSRQMYSQSVPIGQRITIRMNGILIVLTSRKGIDRE